LFLSQSDRFEGLHDGVVFRTIVDLGENDTHGLNHDLYQRDGDMLFLCEADTLQSIAEVFVKLSSILGPPITLGYVIALTLMDKAQNLRLSN
jgi:hypothetical protein